MILAEATRWLDHDDRQLLSLWWLEAAGELTRSDLANALGLTQPQAAVRVQRMRGQLDAARAVVRVRYPYNMHAFPGVAESSAMNADYAYAVWRSCFEGKMTWFNTVERGSDYTAGDAWGCMGVHFSGRWHTDAAEGYIARVRDYLARKIWTSPNFQQP